MYAVALEHKFYEEQREVCIQSLKALFNNVLTLKTLSCMSLHAISL